jgi:hypothetical protein
LTSAENSYQNTIAPQNPDKEKFLSPNRRRLGRVGGSPGTGGITR